MDEPNPYKSPKADATKREPGSVSKTFVKWTQLLCLALATLGLWFASDGAFYVGQEGKMALGILLVVLGCIGFLGLSRRS